MASQYATLADLYIHGAPSASFGSLTSGDREAALQAASEELDAAIASQGTVPLTGTIPSDLIQKVCQIAAYELLCRVGFNPNAGSDRNYLDRAVMARDYFKRVSRGEVHPKVTFTEARSGKAQPKVRSKSLRGW